MIRYLNNDRNVRRNNNENLGRELLELFSMGEENGAAHKPDGYTEQDVRDANTRSLTGATYEHYSAQFRFHHDEHDAGPKTLLGRTGRWGSPPTPLHRCHSIRRSCEEYGKRAAFLNTFGPSFFRFPREKRRRRIAATTCATIAAGLPLATVEDNRAGNSVSHDFTNAFLRDDGADLPLRSPAEAGAVVARGSRDHDFVLFEHFLCDRAGHDADAKMAWQVLKDLEQFLNALLGSLDLTRTVLVLASDHGNIEDLQVPAHTRNPAAVAIFGPEAADRAAHVSDLTHVAPLMREALGLPQLDLSTAR